MRYLIPTLLLLLTSTASGEEAVSVVFEFPDREPVYVQLSYTEAVKLTGDELPYTIEFWTEAALSKAGLVYASSEAKGKRSITSIGGASNNRTRKWVYFVNDVRSPFHINAQAAENVRSIRFNLELVDDR